MDIFTPKNINSTDAAEILTALASLHYECDVVFKDGFGIDEVVLDEVDGQTLWVIDRDGDSRSIPVNTISHIEVTP